jgi:hypothetical protein
LGKVTPFNVRVLNNGKAGAFEARDVRGDASAESLVRQVEAN